VQKLGHHNLRVTTISEKIGSQHFYYKHRVVASDVGENWKYMYVNSRYKLSEIGHYIEHYDYINTVKI